ncbi:MAG: hypothetical protein RL368_2522 [Pseudomonadota bacterium]|jgi:hypothetical protein
MQFKLSSKFVEQENLTQNKTDFGLLIQIIKLNFEIFLVEHCYP